MSDTGAPKLHRNAFGKFGQQCAKTLAAECAGVTLARPAVIDDRGVDQILAAAIGTQNELDRRPPFTEVLGQDLRAGDVALARGVGERAVGAHQRGQKILELAFARVAPADAQPLRCRRGINVEPGS